MFAVCESFLQTFVVVVVVVVSAFNIIETPVSSALTTTIPLVILSGQCVKNMLEFSHTHTHTHAQEPCLKCCWTARETPRWSARRLWDQCSACLRASFYVPSCAVVFSRHTHAHTYTRAHTHTHTQTHTRTHRHTHAHTCTHTHTHAHTRTRTRTHTDTHRHTLARTHIHTYTHTHIHTYTWDQ